VQQELLVLRALRAHRESWGHPVSMETKVIPEFQALVGPLVLTGLLGFLERRVVLGLMGMMETRDFLGHPELPGRLVLSGLQAQQGSAFLGSTEMMDWTGGLGHLGPQEQQVLLDR
jgi:hypothetical protein